MSRKGGKRLKVKPVHNNKYENMEGKLGNREKRRANKKRAVIKDDGENKLEGRVSRVPIRGIEDVSEHGFWWRYSGILYQRMSVNENGSDSVFTKEEVVIIEPQIRNLQTRYGVKDNHSYSLVDVEGEKFYVIVDGSSVELPNVYENGKLIGPIRTKDKNKIPGFRE